MKMIKIYCILLVSIYAQLPISVYAQLPIIISEPENIYERNEPDYIHDHGPFAPNYLDSVAATLKMDDSNIFLFHSSAFYTFKTWGPLDDPKKNVIGLDDYSGLHTKYFEIPLHLANSISTNFAVGEKNFAAIFLKNIYDVGNGELIGFLHLEYMKGNIQFTQHGGPGYPGYPAIYTIGLVYSKDNGDSWTFCGDIIRQHDHALGTEIDHDKNIGGAPYVINGDHIYVYFNEKPYTQKLRYPSVARANLNAVISKARRSTVEAWYKYNSATDDFDQGGLNGLGSPIIWTAADMHADAAYNSYINKYMLIAPYKINTDSGLRLFLSDDGIHFDYECPILLISSPNGIIGDLTYPFFVSLNSDANSDCSVVGREFYVYYSGTDYAVPEFPMSRLKVTIPLDHTSTPDIIGTWPSGIWYRDVAKSKWTKMYSAVPSGDIAAGDFTGDKKADVASIWSGGLYYQNGATLGWTRLTRTAPYQVTTGDVNCDGRSEIIGTWSSGIWHWDVAKSKLTKMWSSVPSGAIAAGDFTGDKKADVASIWSSGLWYQNGATLGWTKVTSTAPSQVTAGDITGDGRAEIIGTWGSGIWYRNVAASSWKKMNSGVPSGDIAAGDFTGDKKADVASCWDSGLWYQNGATLGWTKVTSTAPYELTAGDVTGD